MVDCGASALVALKAYDLDPNGIDGIVLSHLHGDHFGGIPFLLLDAQFLAQRDRAHDRRTAGNARSGIDAGCWKFFSASTSNSGAFAGQVQEIEVGRPTELLGHSVTSAEVVHYSGAPSTALRISDGDAASPIPAIPSGSRR